MEKTPAPSLAPTQPVAGTLVRQNAGGKKAPDLLQLCFDVTGRRTKGSSLGLRLDRYYHQMLCLHERRRWLKQFEVAAEVLRQVIALGARVTHSRTSE